MGNNKADGGLAPNAVAGAPGLSSLPPEGKKSLCFFISFFKEKSYCQRNEKNHFVSLFLFLKKNHIASEMKKITLFS